MIGRKTTLAFCVNLLKHALGYVGLFFVARYMGPRALGIIGFGFAYVGIFNFIADMGFGAAHIKKISEGRDLSKCIGTYLLVRVMLAGAMVVCVLMSIIIYEHVFNKAFESAEHVYVIYIVVVTMVLFNLSYIVSSSFAARKETALQTIPELITKIVEVVLKVIVAIMGLGVIMLAGASLISAVVSLAVYAILFRNYPIGRPDMEIFKEYWAFALPVMVIVSANAMTENLDKVMIQFFCGSYKLGFYVGAARISMVFMFLSTAVGTLIFPTISSYYSNYDIAGIQKLTHRAERYLSLVLLPVGVLIVLFGGEIAGVLLGAEFSAAGPILSILSCSMIISVVSVPYANQIIGTNRVRLSAILSLVLMTLNISLNVLLIPDEFWGVKLFGLGAYGAALATFAATCVISVIYRWFAYRFTSTGFNTRILVHLLSSGLMAFVMHGLLSRCLNLSPLAIIGIILCGLLAYIVPLFSFREISREDLSYFTDLISVSKMKSYILEEFHLSCAGKIKGDMRIESSVRK